MGMNEMKKWKKTAHLHQICIEDEQNRGAKQMREKGKEKKKKKKGETAVRKVAELQPSIKRKQRVLFIKLKLKKAF